MPEVRYLQVICRRGYLKFFKRTELETSQFIKHDCLNIKCTITVVNETIVDGQISTNGYGQLLESKEGNDVTFQVEGQTFYAHKIILSTWSPVFKTRFFGPEKEENNKLIIIEDIQAHIFKALLHYMYYGVMPNVGEDLEAIIMIKHLLVAADRFGLEMERFKTFCEPILYPNISISTAASTLALAEQHGCFHLKLLCLEFIGLPENLNAVMKTDGYKNLKESYPCVIDDLLKSLAGCTYVNYGQTAKKMIPS